MIDLLKSGSSMQTLAATERDKRIHCNWLEQLQIAE